MALVYRDQGKVFRVSPATGEGVNTYILGDAQDGKTGTIALVVWAQAGFAGSMSVLARARNPEAAQPKTPPMPAPPMPFLPIPYLELNNAGAAVSPPLWVATPLTGTCIIEIPATGLAIALDVTAVTAGEAWVFWTPVEGSIAT